MRIKQNIKKSLPFFNESTKNVLFGAVKGVMMIQETYDLNLTEFASGNFTYGDQMISDSFNILDQLDTLDLAVISKEAFKMKWYDTALKYLKESISSLQNMPLNRNINIPHGFEHILQQMRKKFSAFHNKSLINKKKRIGEDWKLFPYFVDQGLLQIRSHSHIFSISHVYLSHFVRLIT